MAFLKNESGHRMKDGDFPRCVRFCHWFFHQCHNPHFLNNIVIRDEASFAVDGKFNTDNVQCYCP